ncbi:MAG: polysulfide reductase NrfD [Candidatus Thiodiazotropha lotti]|uniref:sulfate reduction electron transfer complex DsrMKJOP subunit DsrP n=1 Tax=Candidatus Thiodiazotropha endoloripes TaxID=1818881 RepID=UPI00083DBD14|nr:NrfD/PsrC family molybdoenzyme membrane anchor subunit [Candidatus Thiodiazotropha endoloripes]MCG7902972.1 polysulfide reductase NrfD [Candidatus Thiodiazotropha weberae]MCG7991159.1 polysulfide reductase NrfD [Candidatus Thiodiazotropha lotti]MCG8001369.1 polysulfide reductase NrfD [Candidatus Thiodiazotropha lotti]MCW4182814.1 polysulfide reductase NrfD [Candidatus Thiodiazotropha weberae]MCW4193143.1 polysulfide reductase NrfD [Candidatus Thiodiazotropha weberae]
MRFLQFVVDYLKAGFTGGILFWLWMLFLLFFIMLWGYGEYVQIANGMIVTNLNDQVSWGFYLANFVFMVGVAAAAVTVVFPAYVYKHKELHRIVVLGEMIAIAAVVMCLLFVIAHMGRPDRLWHLLPVIGIFNFPHAMLTWDVIVLNGYLLLNIIGGYYYLYKKYSGGEINKSFYLPVVYIAIVWALSIHTVTAFLINTMPARPMWFHSMMPIKFITTAFAAGPSLIIVVFLLVRRFTPMKIADEAFHLLSQIVVWCLGIALFLTMSEIVTELYPATEHSLGLQYLMFGHNGLNSLVPFFWTALSLMVGSFILLLIPRIRKNLTLLPFVCIAAFVGIWIEKGMGLMLPGVIPTPVGEFAEYTPSHIELMVVGGIWAIGFFLLTFMLKGAVAVLQGEVRYRTKTSKQAVSEQQAEAAT